MNSTTYWRYLIARALIHAGLRILPPGRVRQELSTMLWTWGMRITTEVVAARANKK
jgi:hypothetical protein